MSKILILTEKRSAGYELASTLEDPKIGNDLAALDQKSKSQGYLEGDNYIITWAMGHLYGQLTPKEIDPTYGLYQKLNTPEEYKLKDLHKQIRKAPSDNANKNRQRKILKEQLSRLDIKEIIIATDADAEGETIGRDMIFLTHPKVNVPIKRFWNTGSFKAKEAVKKAMDKILPYNDPKFEALYQSQLARSECDYLTGMKLTKTAVDHYNKPFYIGRVKGVITSLVGNREEEIKNFIPSEYWKLAAKKGDLELSHYYYAETGEKEEDGTQKESKETSYFLKDEIEKVKQSIESDNLDVTVEKFDTETTYSKTRPLPLSGTDFATEMMGKHKITYTQCNDILQYLRDEGFTTYQGTNGRFFSHDDRVDVETSLNTLKSYFKQDVEFTTDTYIFNDKKASKQNHPPLSVTTKVPTEQDLSIWENNKLPKLKEAYELIAKRIMVAFLEDDKIEKQHLIVSSKDGYKFELTGRKALLQGWRTFLNEEIKDTTFSSDETLEVGTSLKLDNLVIKESMTKAPALFTTKTLLATLLNVSRVVDQMIRESDDPQQITKYKEIKKLLKNAEGIGTDRTREGIINDLFENKIIEAEKKDALTLTSRGWELFKVYPSALKSLVLTATWENGFEEIRQGERDHAEFINEVDKIIMEDMIPNIIKNVGKDVKVEVRTESKKEAIEGIVCPLCNSGLVDTAKTIKCSKNMYANGKQSGCKFSIFKDQVKTLGRTFTIPDLEKFFASSADEPMKEEKHGIYFDPKNKYFVAAVWDNNGTPNIAANPNDLIETSKTFKKGEKFVFKEFRGKNLTKVQAEKLLDGKEIELTRKSKADKDYKVKCTLKPNGGLEVVFVKDK
jgi:DNA topoisomerase-3